MVRDLLVSSIRPRVPLTTARTACSVSDLICLIMFLNARHVPIIVMPSQPAYQHRLGELVSPSSSLPPLVRVS